jgi:hypothetical protein
MCVQASEDSMTDLEGMKTMIKVKNKELRHIKKLAQVHRDGTREDACAYIPFIHPQIIKGVDNRRAGVGRGVYI